MHQPLKPIAKVRRLDHVALRSADPKRASSWYRDMLGLEERYAGIFGPESPITVGVGECSLSLFPGEGASFEHVAFELDSDAFAHAMASFDNHGITYRIADHRVATSLYLTDPDGTTVELTTYHSQGATMAADPKHVVTRIVEDMFNQHNLAAADRYVAPDCVDHSGFPGQPDGLAGMKARWQMMFAAFSDFRITIDDLVAEGDKVSMRATGRGTHDGEFFGAAATGKPVVFTEINLSRIVNGHMVEHWAQRSTLEVLKQIGAVPA
ncbi:MAG: ester cyclase [Acidimicrobiales bacterium]